MNISKLLLLALLIVSFSCAQHKAEEKATNQLSGLWSLHIMEQRDTTTGVWNEWRDGMQGYILYGEQGHMSLHLTTKGYEKTDLKFPNFIDTISIEAMKHLTGSYVYFAKYTIDQENSIVEHARISHSNPGDWDKVVRRRFSFLGDTLVLQPAETTLSNLRLKWIKSKNKSN